MKTWEAGFWPPDSGIPGKVPARILAFLCILVRLYALLASCTIRYRATKSPETGCFGASADRGWNLTACNAYVIEFPLFFDILAFPGKVPARI